MSIDHLREQVKKNKAVEVNLALRYTPVFSALHGNFPINTRISGEILDIPVDLRLNHIIVPNTAGNYPVNSSLEGLIGNSAVTGRMPYAVLFNTITGNMPVNTGMELDVDGRNYFLKMPLGWASAPANPRAGGGGRKKAGGKVLKVVYKQGYQMEVTAGGGGGSMQDTLRPIPAGLTGWIEDIFFNLKFRYSFYTNTISGRSPINTSLHGVVTV